MHGVTGLCERPDGVSIAHVVRQKGRPPRLAVCEFIACSDSERSGLLQEFAKQHALSRSRCVGVMTPGSYSLLQVEPPEVPDSEIRDAVRWQIKDLVDFPLDEAVIDVFPMPSQKQREHAKAAYVVAARTSLVQKQAALLHDAKLKIAAIDIPELAIGNLVSLLPEAAKGVAFLYLGRHQGLITVIRNSTLYLARNINVGVVELHQLLQSGPGADLADMELRFHSMLDSIVLEIQRSLDFYESNFSQPPIGSLVVAPPEVEIPALLPHLQSYLGVAVRMLDLGAVLEGPEMPPDRQARCLTAVGAALRGGQASP